MIAAALLFVACAALAVTIRRLARIPPALCEECGHPLGETEHCETCIDWRCYP